MSMSTQRPSEPMYGGYSRFELELEFVQSLANPGYLNHLASEKYLDDPAFVAYIEYLQYFKEPRYLAYLTYPGPTLKALELLLQPRFRDDIRQPDLVYALMQNEVSASFEAH